MLNIGLLTKNTIRYSVRYFISKPSSSEVLTAYLKQCNEPPWTSYFVKVICDYYFLLYFSCMTLIFQLSK